MHYVHLVWYPSQVIMSVQTKYSASDIKHHLVDLIITSDTLGYYDTFLNLLAVVLVCLISFSKVQNLLPIIISKII